jgi:hypothetical protein
VSIYIKAGNLAVALIVILLTPVTVSAHGHHWRQSERYAAQQTSVSVVTPPPVPVDLLPTPSFTLGAFQANIGTVDVEFVDITDLYVPATSKTLFVYLENNTVSNQALASGKYDTELKAWSAKLPPGTIISLGHEFNLTENPWGGNPTTFLAAYKHVHDVVGSGIQWAWVANNSDTPGTSNVAAYWPGAQYVDIVGEDGFDWGGESLSQALQPNFATLKAYGKPLWITSTGTASDQGVWITEGLQWSHENAVSGLLYFSFADGENFTLTPQGKAALK